jgi:hypothetical protein
VFIRSLGAVRRVCEAARSLGAVFMRNSRSYDVAYT